MKRKRNSRTTSNKAICGDHGFTDDADVEIRQNECGIISAVKLRNFMCHDAFDISFGPNVNIITGRNGSGKSAILTALVVGLGGKANVTSRGSSAKGFVKTGKPSCMVNVKLINKGDEAFRPDEFGDHITVERRLYPDGASTYKIRSEADEVVSTKRDDLMMLLEHFNIQVDNPISVLNQDTSRNFLNSREPQDKYKFFLKATQLEQLKCDYKLADEERKIASASFLNKKETMTDLKKQVHEWEKKYNAVKSLDNLRDRIEKLKHEMAWAQVIEKENTMESMEKSLNQAVSRTQKFMRPIEECEAKIKAEEENRTKIQTQLNDIAQQVTDVQPQVVDAKQKLEQAKKQSRKAQMELKELERTVKGLKSDKNVIKTRITEIKSSALEENKTEREEREERLGVLTTEVEQLDSQQRTVQNDSDQYQGAINQNRSDYSRLKTEEESVTEQLRHIRADLRDLTGSRTDRYRLFGQEIPRLVAEVNKAHQRGEFKEKPRGPIGAYIDLKDQQWALGIEKALGGILYSWCVDNHQDSRVLERIMSSVLRHRHPSIFTGKFRNQQHEVNRHAAVSKHPTILQMLSIQDPVIANCLIDQRGIESIILVKDNREARNLLMRNPPKNCREAFTLEGDQVLTGRTFRYYSCDAGFKAKYLKTNKDDDIRQHKESEKRLQLQQREYQQKLRQLELDMKQHRNQKSRADSQVMKIQEELRKKLSEINEIKNIEEPAPIDVATLEDEVEGIEQKLKGVEAELKDGRSALDTANKKQEEAAETYNNLQQQNNKMMENVDPLKASLEETEEGIITAKEHRKHYQNKLKQHQQEIDKLKAQCEAHKKDVEDSTVTAEKISQRVNTRRQPKSLDAEIAQRTATLQEKEQVQGRKEDIVAKFHQISVKFKNILHEMDETHMFLMKLDNIMKNRKMAYEVFRHSISMRVKTLFNMSLSIRHCRGDMTFNHKKETLDLQVVQPGQSMASKDTRGLSGGERSFATVCFILALWDAMESPFRCLDEFDVFMDLVNRRLSMEMMLKTAREQKYKQFIFFTPLDMSSLTPSNLIRLYLMPEPEREEQTDGEQ